MQKWFKDLFSESSDVSMTRFLSFVCVITATLISLYAVGTKSDLAATAGLVSVFLGFGLGAKVSQRFIEQKSGPETPSKD
ncbi:MAG: hypothetical protein ACAH17_03720 [Candidatus Paceibacterota bacterium]